MKRRQTDPRGTIGFNLGSLDVLPLPTRGFTPFRDMLMRKHIIKEMVGRVERRTISAESFDKIVELSNNPPVPGQDLIDLMARKRKFKRE